MVAAPAAQGGDERRETRRQEALIAAGQRRMELLSKAMNAPTPQRPCSSAMSSWGPVPPERRRQFLYVRAVYENMVLSWGSPRRAGLLTEGAPVPAPDGAWPPGAGETQALVRPR
ncbi:DUF6082 family protein [Streptomyces sp. NRRL S-1521]|uniref:DUF6082 family protein n=1 Tax=Streptomyces sp. NRRL S-1521 TaxID=1609100 RepID=UPI003B634DCA